MSDYESNQPRNPGSSNAAPTPSNAAPAAPGAPSPKGGKRRNPAVAVAALVVLAVLAAVGIWIAASFQPGETASKPAIIKENVVVYDASDPAFEILACDADSITVSSVDALPEGTVLAVGVTDATPNGLLRILGAPEPVDGGFRIPAKQAALTDAIEYCDVRVKVALTPSGEYEVRDESGNLLSVQPAYAGDPLNNIIDKDGAWYAVKAGMDIEAKLRIVDGAMVVSLTDRMYASVDFDLAVERSGDISADNPLEDSVTLFDKDLKPFTFTVGGIPVVVTNNLSLSLSASGSAAADMLRAGGVLDRTFGFKFVTGEGFSAIDLDESVSPGLEIELNGPELKYQAQAALEGSATSMLYGVLGMQASLGLGVESKGQVRLADAASPDGKSAAVFELPGTRATVAGSLSAKVVAPVSVDIHGELDLFGDDFMPSFEGNLNLIDHEFTLFELNLPEGAFGEDASAGSGSGAGAGSAAAKPGRIELTQQYTTRWAEVEAITYPAFTFSYPENWKIVQNEVGSGIEYIELQNENGAKVIFSNLPENPGGLGRTIGRADYAKVAESAFVPGYIQATDYTHLGAFMVAEVISTGWLDMITDSEYKPVTDAQPYYCVCPQSWEGTREGLRGPDRVVNGFEYGRLIAFCGGSQQPLSPKDKAEVLAILGSFRPL